MSSTVLLKLDGFGNPVYVPVIQVDAMLELEYDAMLESEVDAEIEVAHEAEWIEDAQN